MAKRQLRFTGFSTYIDLISNELAQKATQTVVRELALISPWYSGEFANNWAVSKGSTPIRATVEARNPRPKTKQTRGTPNIPTVPSLAGTTFTGYSIGNRMRYRNIAMDLEPGRVERAKYLSAPADWYRLYTEGGGLQDALRNAANVVASDPKIKGFTSRATTPFTGPRGVLRR